MNTVISPAKRNTKQKESIFRAVTSVYTHPTAEEVYNMVVVDCPHVSLTTVYRNLNMLVEEGKLRRIAIPNDSDRFDATLTPHYHVKCDKCGANMVIKEGKYGKFLACPNFPECKNIKPFDKPVGKCPICGKDLYKKTSKKGNAFVGCSGYPACNYVSWDVPAPIDCAKCGSPMRVKVVKGDTQYECTKKTCQYVVLAKGGEGSDED